MPALAYLLCLKLCQCNRHRPNTIATLLTPLRPLLSKKKDYLWTNDYDKALTKVKDALTTAPVLSLNFYDASKPTCLCMDANRQELGFMLLQQGNGMTWNFIQAGSRFLNYAESWHTSIELEMLAVCWAVMKCKLFLAGLQHLSIITDHNPVISIINNHRLDEIENPHLQRLKTKLMTYNFTVEWIKRRRMMLLTHSRAT